MQCPIRQEPMQKAAFGRHHVRVPLGRHPLLLMLIQGRPGVLGLGSDARGMRRRVEPLGLLQHPRLWGWRGGGGGIAEGVLDEAVLQLLGGEGEAGSWYYRAY